MTEDIEVRLQDISKGKFEPIILYPGKLSFEYKNYRQGVLNIQ